MNRRPVFASNTINTETPTSVRRRKLILGGTALGALSSIAAPAIARSHKVRYTLSWLPTGQYAYVYAARQLGFWKKRGIDVEISPGSGSMNAIQALVGDKFDIGGAATSAIGLSVLRGLDVQIVGTQGYDSTLGVLAPANGPIKTPKDLAGKKIGVNAAGGDTPFLPAFCELAGVDFKSVEVVALNAQIMEQSVMGGRVDCMIAYGMSSIPNFMAQDFPVQLFTFSDLGLQFYWVNTMVRKGFLAKNSQLVTDFEAGLMEGLRWTMLNPEEAVERHMKEHPEIAMVKNGKEFTELGVGMIAVVNTAPETEQNGLGYSDLAKLTKQTELIRQYVGKAGDPAPPAVETYAHNLPKSYATLSSAEWQSVKSASAKYAKILGRST